MRACWLPMSDNMKGWVVDISGLVLAGFDLAGIGW